MLPDAQLYHYAIQLNVYKYMIERHYGHRVVGLHVVCCHVDNGDLPFVQECPDMTPVVEFLMAHQAVEESDKIDQRKGCPKITPLERQQRLNRATEALRDYKCPKL
jgi:hypothetical protein